MFTSSTIVTSAILFKGFKGTPTSIITVVMGFFVICAGVILLQLSKSAKDVPDTAVFAGDLDQVRTIAEQEQPESEPKADAIRGTAAIVRRFSQARQKWELDEARRLHEEKQRDLEPIGENEQIEWDGLRRRRTTFGTNPSMRSRGDSNLPPLESTTPQPPRTPMSPRMHPPLGMSQFPAESDSDNDEEARPSTGGFGSSFFGTIRGRMSTLSPGQHRGGPGMQSPMHPVPLTDINVPGYKNEDSSAFPSYDHNVGLPPSLRDQKTAYLGASGERHITIVDGAESQRTGSRGSSLYPGVPPTPPPHSARRQFSFQNVFKKGQSHAQSDEPLPQSRSPMIRKGIGSRGNSNASVAKGATEEERLGLVKGDTRNSPELPAYDDEDDEDWMDDKPRIPLSMSPQNTSPDRGPKRDLTPPRRTEPQGRSSQITEEPMSEEEYYDVQKRKWEENGRKGGPPPPPGSRGDAGGGAFI